MKYLIKTTTAALFLGVVMFFSSCDIEDKINDTITFEYTEESNFSIPGSAPIGVLDNLPTPSIQSSSQEEFENNNTSAERVDEVILNELNLSITNPSDRTFSFLSSVKIYISTNTESEILLAERTNIPQNVGSTLMLETTGENIKSYVVEDQFSLRYEIEVRETTASETDINAEMVFGVSAELF